MKAKGSSHAMPPERIPAVWSASKNRAGCKVNSAAPSPSTATGSNAVVIPSAPALNPPQQVSLSAWIYSFTGGRSGPEIIISKDGGQLTQYSLRIENPGLVRFTVGNTSLSNGVHIVLNNWHHVVASFDGRVMRLFVDGVAEPRSLEGPGSIPTTEYPVRIGSGSNARQPMAFNGLLDDVRIYARGLNFVDAASLYREGVENSNSAFIKHAQVSQYSDIYKINNPIASQVPNELIQPWWYSYLSLIEDNGEPPEIKWELACGTLDDTGKLLSCFLKLNPKVRDSIVWVDADPNFHTVIERTYTQWSPARKQQLNTAFFHAFQWMKGGLQTFNGTMLLDPPINQLLQPDAAPAQTGLATDAAWQLYLNTIAHSLAVEIGGFVPWSITGYTTDELQTLFHSKYMFNAGWLNSWANYPDPTPWFGYQPAGDTMEAPPTTFFQFLVDNDMIRGNHEATIERLIDWSRFHLLHILDWEDISALAFEGWWDYRGASPASRILAGTIGRYKTIPPTRSLRRTTGSTAATVSSPSTAACCARSTSPSIIGPSSATECRSGGRWASRSVTATMWSSSHSRMAATLVIRVPGSTGTSTPRQASIRSPSPTSPTGSKGPIKTR